MQGTGKDKSQDADGNGELDHPGLPDRPDEYPNYKLKDGKPYGTYIEVKAYYVSNHEDRVGSGDITYRFMLGKNVTTDYNAERNYHYKLTLKFKIMPTMWTGILSMKSPNQALRFQIPITSPIFITVP